MIIRLRKIPEDPLITWKRSKSVTPKHWRKVRLVVQDGKYSVRSYLGFTKFNPQDMMALLLDSSLKTEALSLENATAIGEKLEEAMQASQHRLKRREKR